MPEQIKYLLDEEQIPKSWYNLSADLPEPVPPVLHPGTQQPIGPADPAVGRITGTSTFLFPSARTGRYGSDSA